MKLIVRGLGHLAPELGVEEFETEEQCLHIDELLDMLTRKFDKLREFFERNDSWNVKAGYLAFVNGIDIRIVLRERVELCNEVIIDIVPVIHHG